MGNWQERRENEFWNIEVNDILYANYEGLRKIFKSYFTKIKKWMEPTEVYYMLSEQLDRCAVSVQQAKYAYTMSKMTVPDTKTQSDKYSKLVFVEFLEVLCRAAR
jgi:hypothetical protein